MTSASGTPDENVDYVEIDMYVPCPISDNIPQCGTPESDIIYIENLELMELPIYVPGNTELHGLAWITLSGYINCNSGEVYLGSDFICLEFYHPLFAELNTVNDCNGFWGEPGALQLYANNVCMEDLDGMQLEGTLTLYGYGLFDYSAAYLSATLCDGMLHIQGYIQLPQEQTQIWMSVL